MKNNFLKTSALLIFTALLILVSCEKTPPLSDNLSDELDFTCESCHTNESVLAQLAPDTGEDASDGGG